MDKKNSILFIIMATMIAVMTSCGGQKSLIIPHAVSTIDAIPAQALNLQKGDYDILSTVTETASVTASYSGKAFKIQNSDGDFSYTFKFDAKTGWHLDRFSGTASLGYILGESINNGELPAAEEVARRVAIARLIENVKDYGADAILEPIVTTRASNVKHGVVEYQAVVTAKIVKIHTTN